MNINKPMLFAALTLVAASVHAQTNFEWTGDANTNNWDNRGNWSPDPGQVIGGGSSVDTVHDRVTISEGNVERVGNINFRTGSTSDSRKGTFDAITLTKNASLTVDGTLMVTSSSGGYTRNVAIDSGSTLTATTISTGTQNSSDAKSTWAINGTLEATTFRGYQASTTSSLAGGYILNVDGGALNVSGTFNWSYQANAANANRVGEINISNNGIVNIGTMAGDWTDVAGNMVTFVDGSGILKFGYDNWNLAAVENLITNNYIRKDAAVLGNIEITDTGTGWQVGVVAIPEASTTAMIGGSIALALICLRRRVRSRA